MAERRSKGEKRKMDNNFVKVRSESDSTIVINLPEMQLHRTFRKRGQEFLFARQDLMQAYYDPSVEYLFTHGFISTDDVEFKESVGLIQEGKDVVTSRFTKSRTITVNGKTQTGAHTGIDIVCISKSSPKVCAAASGTVVVAKAGSTGYGNYVVLQHLSDDGKRYYTLYGEKES